MYSVSKQYTIANLSFLVGLNEAKQAYSVEKKIHFFFINDTVVEKLMKFVVSASFYTNFPDSFVKIWRQTVYVKKRMRTVNQNFAHLYVNRTCLP